MTVSVCLSQSGGGAGIAAVTVSVCLSVGGGAGIAAVTVSVCLSVGGRRWYRGCDCVCVSVSREEALVSRL